MFDKMEVSHFIQGDELTAIITHSIKFLSLLQHGNPTF
jgi:hypothetical protein